MPNKTQLKGKAKEAIGATREKAGKMTGIRQLQSRGAAQKREGKLEGAFGKVKRMAGGLKDKVS
jgi:uncharacterized protein YjbJ (UPF0337 family)